MKLLNSDAVSSAIVIAAEHDNSLLLAMLDFVTGSHTVIL